ncbi:unnamed protein product [Amoebophrya sp. A25]|nr:unnamed protein product [Amoebophrya sp. A25]|eukprot:GSA25T00004804001.1
MIEYVSPYETPFGKWLFYLTWMFLPLLPWLLMSIIWQYPIPPLEFFSRLVSGSHDPPADPTWGFVLERATLQGLALTSGAILLLVWFLVELMYIPLRYICGVECCGAEVGDPGCCEERDKAQLEGFCFGCLFKTCKNSTLRGTEKGEHQRTAEGPYGH